MDEYQLPRRHHVPYIYLHIHSFIHSVTNFLLNSVPAIVEPAGSMFKRMVPVLRNGPLWE
jgi:hypothetical protein